MLADRGHIISLSLFAFVLAISSIPEGQRWHRTMLIGGATSLVFGLGASVAPPFFGTAAFEGVPGILRSVASVIRPASFRNVQRHEKERVLLEYSVSPSLRTELAKGTVHIEPYDAALAWALVGASRWNPSPVFQSYQADTPSLDRLNADHFVGSLAPDFVVLRTIRLRRLRNQLWESPQSMVALVCNYEPVSKNGQWWVARRTKGVCFASAKAATSSVSAGFWAGAHNSGCAGTQTVSFSNIRTIGADLVTQLWALPPSTVSLRSASGIATYEIPRRHLSGPMIISGRLPGRWEEVFGPLPPVDEIRISLSRQRLTPAPSSLLLPPKMGLRLGCLTSK